MATAVDCGQACLRELTGESCDWCGDECHPNSELCVAASCLRCGTKMYHQNCLEKFLKKFGFASNRKCGFPCPFGHGKGTKHAQQCKGKVDKSHPIIPKNEDKKKARVATPPLAEVVACYKPPTKAERQAAAKAAAADKAKATAAKAAAAAARKAAAAARPPPAPQPTAAILNRGAPIARPVAVPAVNAWARPQPAIFTPADEPAAPGHDEALLSPDGPRPAQVPVGWVLEEALTKAQKKNLARKKKRAAAVGCETISEAGTAATDLTDAASVASDEAPVAAPAAGGQGADLMCGARFITDPKRYAQLLGLYAADSNDSDADDASDASATPRSPLSQQLSFSLSSAGSSGGASSSAAAAVGGVEQAREDPVPAAVVAAPPALGEAAELELQRALEASRAAYKVEQEMQAQRAILAGGAPPAARAPALAAPSFPAPLAAPLVPVPAPVAVPVASPVPSWLVPAPVPVQAPPASVVGTMVAGRSGAEAAAGDDDDDLGSLLALCGVGA